MAWDVMTTGGPRSDSFTVREWIYRCWQSGTWWRLKYLGAAQKRSGR